MHTRIKLLSFALLATPACAYEDEDDLEFRPTTVGSSSAGDGPVLNTNEMGNGPFSEIAPLDVTHEYRTISDVVVPAQTSPTASYEVVAGEMVVRDTNQNQYTGAALVGSDWMIHTGGWLVHETMRLAQYSDADGTPRYLFTHAENNLWVGTCKDGAQGTVFARMLSGFALNETSGDLTAAPDLTFIACANGAVGKAADWGYFEAAEASDDLELFEMAIRVVRADYCYDGVPHTKTGIPLYVQNRAGVPERYDGGLLSTPANSEIEAVWGYDGLVCAGTGRYEDIPGACGDRQIPACASGAQLADYPEGMIMTRIPT